MEWNMQRLRVPSRLLSLFSSLELCNVLPFIYFWVNSTVPLGLLSQIARERKKFICTRFKRIRSSSEEFVVRRTRAQHIRES